MKRFILIPFVILALSALAQEKPVPQQPKTVCPVCKTGKFVIPIAYGKPTQATVKRAEKGEVWLGGCIVGQHSPRHYCSKDKYPF